MLLCLPVKSFNLWKWYYLYHISPHFSHVTCVAFALLHRYPIRFFFCFFFFIFSTLSSFLSQTSIRMDGEFIECHQLYFHHIITCGSFIIFDISLVSAIFSFISFLPITAFHELLPMLFSHRPSGKGIDVCVCNVFKLEASGPTLNHLNSDENVWIFFFFLPFCYFPVLITKLSLRWSHFYV